MDMEKINRWAGIIGNVGVLVGIALVLIELNQTNDLMAAQDRYNRLSAYTSNNSLYLQNADLPMIYDKIINGEQPSAAESSAVDLFLRNSNRVREWTFQELPSDDLPLEQWRRAFRDPLVSDQWKREKIEYNPEFREYIELFVLNN